MFFLQTNGSGVLSFAGVSASAGQVIQVLTATDSTQRSTTSSSFVTGSNTLSVTITPSSSSNNIFIMVTGNTRVNADYSGFFTIYRGATNLGHSTGGFQVNLQGTIESNYPLCMSFLDSPSTTSAITYQVYYRVSVSGQPTLINHDNSISVITCMEIKG